MSCTGLVMKARRERLGISATTLSRILQVREDNIRKWETPGTTIPDFVEEELTDIEEVTAEVVSDVIESWKRFSAPIALWSSMYDVPQSSLEEIREFGIKWWRGVIATALEQCPDMEIIEVTGHRTLDV